MTTLLSWNIQAGTGVDGCCDLARTVQTINALADADIICLQEIERFDPPAGGATLDQLDFLAQAFPAHVAVFGACLERASHNAAGNPCSYQFGNLVLSRLPVASVFRHPLPQPAVPGIRNMPRQATELTLLAPSGPLRVVTTHLEYHSAPQRLAQIGRLRELHAEVAALTREPGAPLEQGPYARFPRAASAVICGDFNLEPDAAEYRALLAPFADGTAELGDAWCVLHPGQPHAPTCGVFDHAQWPMGAHCRDFFFVTQDLESRLRSFRVDLDAAASDHQPIVIELADG
ncbi:MAG: endonuclease [Gammaproteobacteria bacterium]|nr:endonuclease [Gammaproteobacteria bacterium]